MKVALDSIGCASSAELERPLQDCGGQEPKHAARDASVDPGETLAAAAAANGGSIPRPPTSWKRSDPSSASKLVAAAAELWESKTERETFSGIALSRRAVGDFSLRNTFDSSGCRVLQLKNVRLQGGARGACADAPNRRAANGTRAARGRRARADERNARRRGLPIPSPSGIAVA